ncbi:MAG: ornithine carbamoyltransferase [Rhodospirillaceae bacterium]|nr:ornithine carbamoyltransferase [Rhodospirillaceae bacterium]
MNGGSYFLDLDLLDSASLRAILDSATALKLGTAELDEKALKGKVLALIFERPSTRTRVSFQVAMSQMGGQTVVLSPEDTQLGRGESMADTARVLSEYVDGIMIRAERHETLHELARFSRVPIINGLTDKSHPCQLMADIMTFEEHRGPIAGRVVAWSGDGNNVATSWVHAAVRFGFELRLACPETLGPDPDVVRWAESEGGRVTVSQDPVEAVSDADCVVTDTWFSMGLDDDAERQTVLAPFQVNEDLMARAKSGAIFMHCLPAHRGQEVTARVIDGPHSIVWEGAGNRLHAQKGILRWCLSDGD